VQILAGHALAAAIVQAESYIISWCSYYGLWYPASSHAIMFGNSGALHIQAKAFRMMGHRLTACTYSARSYSHIPRGQTVNPGGKGVIRD
jgi:hypothetical protein